jgi:hypothetical protein
MGLGVRGEGIWGLMGWGEERRSDRICNSNRVKVSSQCETNVCAYMCFVSLGSAMAWLNSVDALYISVLCEGYRDWI